LSPVSAAAANGVVWLTRYAAAVRSAVAILVTLVAAGACRDPSVEQMTAIQRTVCACKTTSCAEQELKRVPSAAIHSTHRTQALARELLDCMVRLQAAERPSTDPDEEPDLEPGSTAPESSAPGPTAPEPGRDRAKPGAS
jgi:hypothetical protein